MSTRHTWYFLLFWILSCGIADAALKELDSYVAISDEFITRPADATDIIFYGTDLTLISAKLKEYGLTFPDNMHFPQGGLFIITITDHINESFADVSADASKQLLFIDLQADKEAAPPKAASGRKTSRVLVTGCPTVKNVKNCAIKTADGVQHAVKSQELKK